MTIVMPLAGKWSLDDDGHFYPLPLREVSGKPLIQYVIENLLKINGNNKFIYILREEDCLRFHLDKTLKLLTSHCEVVILPKETNGAVCSILMAVEKIAKDEEAIIVNGDQVFNLNLDVIIDHFRNEGSDAGLITFESVHPRWSYALVDENNDVLQVEEKNPISKHAIAGFYYFRLFNDFIRCAFDAIKIESYFNKRLYTSSLINQMVLLNKKVSNKTINSDYYISFYSGQKIAEFQKLSKKNKKEKGF